MNELYVIENSVLTGLTEEGKRQGIFTLPEGITNIVDDIFDNVSVQEITFPSSLKNIPEWILMGHTELEKVTISKGTEKIMEYAFSGCYALKDVTIPDSVTEIESFAFEDCRSLKSLHLPESVKVIDDGVFCGCSSLEEIEIPDGVEFIYDYTFYGCKSLKEIKLPDALQKIYAEPFGKCTSLRTITLPENVSRIDKNVFMGCPSLTDIFIESDNLELGDGVYVPNGCRVHRSDPPVDRMTDEKAKKAYFEVCRHEFPQFVAAIENHCSAGYDGTFENSEYRTKEEVLAFALRLITDFGPYPSENGFTKDAWDYAFDDWDEICPPTPGLKACGTDSMSREDLIRWYDENHDSID